MSASSLRFAVVAVSLLAVPAVGGPDWLEPGDADRLPPGQTPNTLPGGPLTSIMGTLGGPLPAEGVAIDMEDVYRICITDPVNFRAWTECPGAVFDAQLWLFTEQEFGLLANDNDFGLNPHALIQPPATDGTGQNIPGPGIYYIAITADGNQALSPGGPIFDLSIPFEISGPDGPGAGNPINDWTGGGPFSEVEYIIRFQPGTACMPEDEVALRMAEIRVDQPDVDLDEYAEITGPFNTPLDDVWYIVIGGDTDDAGVIEEAIDLSGLTIPVDGRFLIAEDLDTFGAIADLITPLNFVDQRNATHALVLGFKGVVGLDLDFDDDGVLEFEPWFKVLDCLGLVGPDLGGGPVYCPEVIGPDGDLHPSHVYRCEFTDMWALGAFEPDASPDTPGSVNPTCPCPADCAQPPDGQVNIQDLLALLSGWGGGDVSCDLNFDGVIDVQDLLILLASWGPCV